MSAILCLVFLVQYTSQGQTSPDARPREKLDFKDVPAVKWTFKTGQPIYSSPVLDNGRVYFGGLDSVLYTLNAGSGKEIWRFRTGGGIRSEVCIAGSILYLNGGDGILYALDKESGKVIWKFLTGGEKKYDFADYFHSTPVFYEGCVFLGSGDGNMYALNAMSGTLIWKFSTGAIIHNKPAISNNRIFFGDFDGYVYALDVKSGEHIWKFKTVGHRYFPKGEVQGSPAVFGRQLFIGARDYNIYALDQGKGYSHWNKVFTNGWGLANQVYDSVLYTGGADEKVLVASDPVTGKELWKTSMGFLIFGNNAFSGNMMFVGTTIGKLHGIDIRTGSRIWSFKTESYLKARTKYFKPDDSYRDDIYSIIKSNEQFLEVEIELGGIFSTPLIYEDKIFFTSTNGMLYCLTYSF